MKVGDKIIPSEGYIPNDFDRWGRGEGVGTVIEVFEGENFVDVKWPKGSCYENLSEIQLDNSESCGIVKQQGNKHEDTDRV